MNSFSNSKYQTLVLVHQALNMLPVELVFLADHYSLVVLSVPPLHQVLPLTFPI